MPLSVFSIIELVTRNLLNYLFSDSKVSGKIACKSGILLVHVIGLWPVCAINLWRDQSSDKLIIFLDLQLDTRDLRLDPPDSRLDARNYGVSSLKARGFRLEGLSTYF